MKKSQENKHRILVLDGDHKNALAIVRHLGKTGKYVIDAVSCQRVSISFYSKYVSRKLILTNPKKDREKYIEELLETLEKNRYLALIPVSYISFRICAACRDRIRQFTHLTITGPDNILLASSKGATYEHARKTGVPYPETIILQAMEDLETIHAEYPCVIKAPYEMGRNVVSYARNKQELTTKYRQMCEACHFTEALPVIQKYVDGSGFGFFAYYQKGECKNWFVHRRLREYPVSGGASTAAESFFDEKIVEYGKRMLDSLRWDGVAMVEFKQDKASGTYYLMEINAKFWGSLDLALLAGVNFPQMLIDEALDKKIEKVSFKEKIRFQWILNGDLFHVLEKPGHILLFLRDLFVAKNDFYFSDIKPNLFQILFIPLHYYKKFFK
ncbi:MAG: ATP-grasp domain-containing protein [Bacteroidales bacterium]|jgi:predicted ATP-grasp superfamily ATP-dependent carboligase|nr:ATP-grasp domain-containing protein [Bacteroidales bacterium]